MARSKPSSGKQRRSGKAAAPPPAIDGARARQRDTQRGRVSRRTAVVAAVIAAATIVAGGLAFQFLTGWHSASSSGSSATTAATFVGSEACAGCHRLIDPVGFSLEQFDAVGRWRARDEGRPIDAAGGLPDGSEFAGVAGMETALLRRPELFARTVTEKLFTFALGRAPEAADAPAIRQIVRDARDHRVAVRPIDVNASEWDCTLEPDRASLGGLALRLGLRLCAGLAEADGRAVAKARRTGNGAPFGSVEEVARRAGVGRRALEALAAAEDAK